MISGEVIRAVKDLINVLDGAERTATEIKDEYVEVYGNLPLDAFPKVKIDTGLLLAEAIYLASLVEKTRTLQNIQTYLLTLPQGERRVLYGDFLKACEGRFNRLMKLLSVIDYEMFQLQDKEIKLGEKQLGDKALEVWNGANYRERVKANVNSLGNLLKKEVITAFLLGKTEKQVRNSIIEFLLKGSELSRRLIRTESTRVHCQAKVELYKKQGYTKYRYVAVLDKRTSVMCRSLNGEVFNLDDANVGVNLPPLHPWCRSTIIPVKE